MTLFGGALELHKQIPLLDPDSIGSHLGKWIDRRDTGFEVELPKVPGAGDHTFLNRAFVKRASAVWASFIQGKKLSLVAE